MKTKTKTIPGLLLQVCKELKIGPENSFRTGQHARNLNGLSGLDSIPVVPRIFNKAASIEQLKSKEFRRFSFETEEIILISTLFSHFVDTGHPISTVRLLKLVFRDQFSSINHLSDVKQLVDDGIISLMLPRQTGFHLANQIAVKTTPSSAEVFQASMIQLSEEFLNYVMKSKARKNIRCGYRTNQEYLDDYIDYYASLVRFKNIPKNAQRRRFFDPSPSSRLRNIKQRLERTKIVIPLRETTAEYDLEPYEELTLVYLTLQKSRGLSGSVAQLTAAVEDDKYSREKIVNILNPKGKLQKRGLMNVTKTSTPMGAVVMLSMDQHTYGRIVSNDSRAVSHIGSDQFINSPVLRLSVPENGIDRLVLPEHQMTVIRQLVEGCSEERTRILRGWGFGNEDHDSSDRAKSSCRMLLLLYGKPGVGKTHCAGVLAKELNKQLLTVDFSRVFDSLVGGSEKNLRKILTAYDLISSRTENPPLLLLNECDQILSSRIRNISHSTDQMLNRMQCMLLEFLERFRGVLVATTNLVQNLDAAFDRRFTHKIELTLPDRPTRLRLWQLLLPEHLPLGADIDIESLAKRYSMSGGQIEMVIHNTATEVAGRRVEDRVFCQADLMKHAALELAGSFSGTQNPRIGFFNEEQMEAGYERSAVE